MEHFFTCPYCWERIPMVLDDNGEKETVEYIEDCEVCCRPIELRFRFDGGSLVFFEALKMEGI